MTNETYAVKCKCSNCNHEGAAEFAKGTPVPTVLECPNCGCETAKKAVNVELPPFPPTRPTPSPKKSESWLFPLIPATSPSPPEYRPRRLSTRRLWTDEAAL